MAHAYERRFEKYGVYVERFPVAWMWCLRLHVLCSGDCGNACTYALAPENELQLLVTGLVCARNLIECCCYVKLDTLL